MIGTVVFAMVFNIPRLAKQTLVTDENGRVRLATRSWANELFVEIYEEALYAVFIYILPLLSLSVLTIFLLVHLR